MKKSIVLLPLLTALSLVYLPQFWIYVFLIADFYTPWVIFDSKLFLMYHNFLVDRLQERPEMDIPSIPAEEATYDKVFQLSKGFTFPMVIRGLLINSSAVQQWGSKQWWVDNYGQEQVLCGTLSSLKTGCTMANFFEDLEAGKPYYISGASKIFDKNKELHAMVDSEAVVAIEPGKRTATQMFMGTPAMGSDIHCATGINVFRQVAGQKKWWFLPPSQTPYLLPSINKNGFSAHTHTMVGKGNGQISPWMSKLERYTAVLNPGDVLINPPWFWHGIKNLGDDPASLVIGVPSRYSRGVGSRAAFKSNPVLMIIASITLYQKYGNKLFDLDFNIDLEDDIADNRAARKAYE